MTIEHTATKFAAGVARGRRLDDLLAEARTTLPPHLANDAWAFDLGNPAARVWASDAAHEEPPTTATATEEQAPVVETPTTLDWPADVADADTYPDDYDTGYGMAADGT